MVNGTPSDCVNLAVNCLLPEKPVLVISGINKGANLSDDIPYSVTVAAAFEATVLKIPAIAVSLPGKDAFIFGPAANFTARLAKTVLEKGLPPNTFLNVNIPDTDGKKIASYKITHQGRSIYANTVTERIDPRGGKYYWIGGEGTNHMDIPGSDSDAVSRNFASITPIKTDLTDYSAMKYLDAWEL
jgi:5'-nucleotidase